MSQVLILGQGQASMPVSNEALEDFPQRLLRRMPQYARMGLLAAARALKSACLFPAPENAALVIGSRYGPQKESLDFMDSLIADGPALSMPMAFANSVGNSAAGLLGQALGLKGPAFSIYNEDQSFRNAMRIGITLIQARRVAVCLVGSMEEADQRLMRLLDKTIFPSAYFLLLSDADS